MSLTIADICRESREIAVAHGFREQDKDLAIDIALMHSELSEALEEHRQGHTPRWTYHEGPCGESPRKPCGIPSEFADVVIRVCETCAHHGIDLEAAILEKMAFNRQRPYRHGGKTL